MEASYWQQKWERNEIAFHQSEANPLLVKYFNELSLAKNSRVFLPLCGKTLDISWLLFNGYSVVGVELSKTAIEQLFTELGIEPKISVAGKMAHYSAKNIDIFVGDIFDLSKEMLGKVDAIYDRAALVALPEKTRSHYTTHLVEITGKVPQLLICYEYDQNLMEGPPFSISKEQVSQYYKDKYDLTLIATIDVTGGLKGHAAKEHVWLLKNN